MLLISSSSCQSSNRKPGFSSHVNSLFLLFCLSSEQAFGSRLKRWKSCVSSGQTSPCSGTSLLTLTRAEYVGLVILWVLLEKQTDRLSTVTQEGNSFIQDIGNEQPRARCKQRLAQERSGKLKGFSFSQSHCILCLHSDIFSHFSLLVSSATSCLPVPQRGYVKSLNRINK